MENHPIKTILGLVTAGIAFFFGLTIVFGCYYTIDQKERGILIRNGAVITTLQPGLGFKWPWIERVVEISLENRLSRWEKLEGYSHDQQASHYMISANYQIAADKIVDAFVIYGGEQGVLQRIVAPNVLKISKVVIGQFTAQTSIQDRGRLNLEVTKALQEATAGTPVQITSVNVEDIKFGGEYENSINARMIAEVQVQTLRQNWEREKVSADILRTQANGKADALRASGQAEADRIKFIGTAEAFAIEARSKALGQNANLVTLMQAEKWNGVLPHTMVPGSALPMINLGK